MTESDEVSESGRQETRVYDFRMDPDAARTDAAPVSASIFDSSLRSAPYVFTCVCAREHGLVRSVRVGYLRPTCVPERRVFGMGHLHGMLLEGVA